MMRAILIAAFVLKASALCGAETLIIRSTGPGRYYLRIDVDQDGNFTIHPLAAVKEYVLGDGTPPPPDDDDDPPPDPSVDFAKIAKDAMNRVTEADKHRTKIVVAEVYSRTANLTGSLITTSDQLQSITNGLYAAGMRAISKSDDWKPWKDEIDRANRTHLQGRSLAEWTKAWNAYAEALKE